VNSPSTSWPFSSIVLVVFGAALIAMGGFFLLQRPALLPEDLRFIGQSAAQVDAAVPGLRPWLVHVFRVMGGYIITAGILMITLAVTSFRHHHWGAAAGVLLAGAASIGWMMIVNFIIDSDYKWLLLAIFALWALSLAMFAFETRRLRELEQR
jgi:hypothetical protein